MGKSRLRIRYILGAFLAVSCTSGAAMADDVAGFYTGRTMEMVVGYPPGGSNDLYARLVAAHLGKHIPGHPRIIVQNMPGA
ncbi:MAG: hypothetical protein JWL62_3497, partial [Hyphomicrobiales bacterium]|nr:hypothetical protein [Hyphomicrobiales bacterium]